MITPVTSASQSVSLASNPDYRTRFAGAERSLTPIGSPPVGPVTAESQDGTPPEDDQQSSPRHDLSQRYADAVIRGSLSPTPDSLEELFRRIGSSTLSPESEARLKDLFA